MTYTEARESRARPLLAALKRWWWRLWSGFDSLAAKRHALEQDVIRLGGSVMWRDPP